MSYKLRLTLIVSFLFWGFTFKSSTAQGMHLVDSLKVLLETAKEDTQKVKLLNSISVELISTSSDTAMQYAKQALLLAKKHDFKFGIIISYNIIGLAYCNQVDYPRALDFFFKALKIAKELDNKSRIIIILNNIGSIYLNQGDYPKALDCFLKALNIAEELGDINGIAANLSNIGNIYYNQGNYQMALDYYLRVLKIDEDKGDKYEIAADLGNVGNIYYIQGDYLKTLDYFFKSLIINESLGDKKNISKTYSNIGELFITLGSDTVYNPVLAIQVDSIIHQYPLEMYSTSQAIIPHGKNGIYYLSLQFLLKAVKLQEEIGAVEPLAYTLGTIGKLYVKTNMAFDAIPFFLRSIKIAKEIGSRLTVSNSYADISFACMQISSQTNNSVRKIEYLSKAYNYLQMHLAIKDTLFNENSTKAIAEMQTKYETEKKEKEIEMLTKDNELQALKTRQQDDQIKKQWLLIIAIVFVLGLAFSLMYVIYSQFKFKKAANEELELKNRTVEEINKELDKKNRSVAESINYAQRIQETIMPTQNHLQKYFPESFIFYKAKDVISGDFPWVWSFNEKNDGIYVSAVDCTGHGIPGAMMSMIGYFLLNEIVNNRKIHQPSEILNHLHEGIKHTLRQEENLESKDGMDIALCNIRKNQMEVQFAGAHRPMLLLHNGEIIELKGNRFPIGGLQYSSRGKEIKFTNHILKLEKGDSIYFYSDGLVDQIGGQSEKRFRNDRVKKIILENRNKSMQEIHDIMNKEFMKWMGNSKQLDDVLMVGIRM